MKEENIKKINIVKPQKHLFDVINKLETPFEVSIKKIIIKPHKPIKGDHKYYKKLEKKVKSKKVKKLKVKKLKVKKLKKVKSK